MKSRDVSSTLTKKGWERLRDTAPVFTSPRSHAFRRSFARLRVLRRRIRLPSAPARASFWPVARGLRPWAGVAKACLPKRSPCRSSEFPSSGDYGEGVVPPPARKWPVAWAAKGRLGSTGAGAATMNSPVDPGARQALKKKPPERTPEVRPADPSSLPLSNGQHPSVGPKLAATVPLPEPRTCCQAICSLRSRP